jgi:hypothetical protein
MSEYKLSRLSPARARGAGFGGAAEQFTVHPFRPAIGYRSPPGGWVRRCKVLAWHNAGAMSSGASMSLPNSAPAPDRTDVVGWIVALWVTAR